MELLLLEDVNGIGKKNDLIVVGDGFALNHLLPARKALVATPTVRKRYAEQIRKRAEEKESEKQMQQNAAAALAGKTVHFKRKVTKTGKLYAAITEKNIAEALKEEHSFDVAESAVIIADHIKATGAFPVQIDLGSSKQTIQVVVEKE